MPHNSIPTAAPPGTGPCLPARVLNHSYLGPKSGEQAPCYGQPSKGHSGRSDSPATGPAALQPSRTQG